MHATRNRLSAGVLGLSAALLLLLAACDQGSDEGAVAPGAGTEEPAATPETPTTDQPATQ